MYSLIFNECGRLLIRLCCGPQLFYKLETQIIFMTVLCFFLLTLITEFIKFINHLNQKMRTAKVIKLIVN